MESNKHITEKRKIKFIYSLDDIFILTGILLNGMSVTVSFIYGHLIAGLILLVCEIVLIGIYTLKML